MDEGASGTVPNGIHIAGSEPNGGGIANGVANFSTADVVMSDPFSSTAATETAEPVKAAINTADGHLAGAPAAAPFLQAESSEIAQSVADPSGTAAVAVSEPKDPLLTAYEAQQEAVTADPGDFNKWVSLIGAAEKLADITRIRQVYDAFFREYPLCFGYWKKYADAEQRHTSTEAAVQVYERGIAAVAYSADLWGQYAVFKQKNGFSAGAVLSVFERGAQIVGRDPGAHGFWDKYIRYADSIKEPFRVASIYKRALGHPLKQLDKYMTGVTEYVEQHSVAELFPVASERAALEATVKQKQASAAEAAERAAAEAQAASAAAAAAQAAEAAAAAAALAEAPVIGPLEAPQQPPEALAAAEAAAAAPQTPPTSSETELYVQPAPADMQANLADHVGPVTPPPGNSSLSQPAPGSVQLDAAQNGLAQNGLVQAGHPAQKEAQEEAKADQGSAAAGIVAPTRGEAGPVDPEYASAAAQHDAQPMQVDSAATNGTEPPPVPEADIKEAWLQSCRTLYESTKEELTRRKAFEDVIRRPYFHVKPLDAAQLSAWSHYIDYMDAKGDEQETRHLYERCLVACARYTDFWMRYIRYLEPKDVPAAKHAVKRGQRIHCKGISETQLFAARFHERHGDIPEARAAYGLVLGKLAPGLISAVLAHANLERRQGNKVAACAVYQKAIAAAAGRGSDGEKTFAYLTVQYAHFLMVVYKDVEAARSAYSMALEKLPGSHTLWEGAIHLEQIAGAPVEETAKSVLGMYQKAIASADLLPSDKEDLSGRACTFADMCGSAAMQEAAERLHAARVKSAADASTSTVGMKRPAETSEEHSPSKQAKATSAAYPTAYPAPAPAAAYSAAPYAPPAAPAAPIAPAAGYYGQSAAGYGQYPGYAYPGYGQPGYPAYSYPQY